MNRGRNARRVRRESAEDCRTESAKLSPQQRLDKLDRNGHRALKQRAKLEKLIEKEQE